MRQKSKKQVLIQHEKNGNVIFESVVFCESTAKAREIAKKSINHINDFVVRMYVVTLEDALTAISLRGAGYEFVR